MKIIAGEYKGKELVPMFEKIFVQINSLKQIEIQDQIVKYEIIDEQKQKSLRSALVRGAIGSLLGPVGLLGGVLTAKNIENKIVYLTLKGDKRIIVKCGLASEYHKLLKIIAKLEMKEDE